MVWTKVLFDSYDQEKGLIYCKLIPTVLIQYALKYLKHVIFVLCTNRKQFDLYSLLKAVIILRDLEK
jgi:hypothetical protein